MKKDKISEFSIIWSPPSIPRCSFISWLAVKGKLITMDKLKKRNIHIANRCILCKASEEDLDHSLTSCPFSLQTWNLVWSLAKLHLLFGPSLSHWFLKASNYYKGNSPSESLGKLCLNLTLYHLWKERNGITQLGTHSSPQGLPLWSSAKPST